MAAARAPHEVPLRERAKVPAFTTHSVAFYCTFVAAMIAAHSVQLLLLPLYFISHKAFTLMIAFTKHFFGVSLIAITHFYGPSTYEITADESVDLTKLVETDEEGKVLYIHFEPQTVWMSNHQSYLDWVFLWILFVYGGISSGLLIILKASLKWVPIVGPAMQLFGFAFIDKKHTLQQTGLIDNAKAYHEALLPSSVLIFPEGTLVSRLTRPKSVAFSEANGIADTVNLLLPRHLGLLYCLRSMAVTMPQIGFYDITIGYPGVPPAGYAQDYYSLMSVFSHGISPPTMHLHIRQHDIKKVPLGNIRPGSVESPLSMDKRLSQAEKDAFGRWTLDRWREKDDLMSDFYEEGRFPNKGDGVSVRVGLRDANDYFLLSCVALMPWMSFHIFRSCYWPIFKFLYHVVM